MLQMPFAVNNGVKGVVTFCGGSLEALLEGVKRNADCGLRFSKHSSVNSDEKLPKSAEIKIPRVGNSMLAQASASQTFPDQVFLETLPSFLRDLQVIIPAGNWAWLLSLCFAGGGAGFQRLRGQVMEHPGLALLMQTITLPSNINRRRVMQQAVQHGSGQDIIRHHVTPFAIGFITGQDDAAFVIAAADQTKEKLR